MLSSSPRFRRRLTWLGGLVVLAGVGAAALLVIPARSDHIPQRFDSQPAQLVKDERQVSLNARDRRAIDALLDRFVVDAVGRRDPGAAYYMASAAMRASVPRRAWIRGDIPVQPLDVLGTRFHGWRPSWSFRNEVNFELLVHARPGSIPAGITYSVDVKREHGRWLVDSFATSALWSPPGSPNRVITHRDYAPIGASG